MNLRLSRAFSRCQKHSQTKLSAAAATQNQQASLMCLCAHHPHELVTQQSLQPLPETQSDKTVSSSSSSNTKSTSFSYDCVHITHMNLRLSLKHIRQNCQQKAKNTHNSNTRSTSFFCVSVCTSFTFNLRLSGRCLKHSQTKLSTTAATQNQRASFVSLCAQHHLNMRLGAFRVLCLNYLTVLEVTTVTTTELPDIRGRERT